MIDPAHPLSLTKQAAALGISRGSIYYLPHAVSERDQALMNTDQGSQFTSLAFTRYLSDNGIQISMDGKGAWRDNVFIERLWIDGW